MGDFTHGKISIFHHHLEDSFFFQTSKKQIQAISKLGDGDFFISSLFWGNDSHFDVHIFQMGWFNHQLSKCRKCLSGGVGSVQQKDGRAIGKNWKVC